MQPHFLSLSRKSKVSKVSKQDQANSTDSEKKNQADKKSATLGDVILSPHGSRRSSTPMRSEHTRSKLMFSRDTQQKGGRTKVPAFESEGAEFTVDHSSSLIFNEPDEGHRGVCPIEFHVATPRNKLRGMDTGEASGETNALSTDEFSSGNSSGSPAVHSRDSDSPKGKKGKLVRESKQVYKVDASTPGIKIAEMVRFVIQNKLGSQMGTVRVLKMMYCATGGEINYDRKEPETGSCAQRLSNLLGHERLDHVQALYVKLQLHLTPIQDQVIVRYIESIQEFWRRVDIVNRDCSILLLNDYIRTELIKLGVDMS